jgi:hypothetical protein
MAVGNLDQHVQPMDLSGGTGARFARAIIIVAGACALVASLLTFVSVFNTCCTISTDVAQRRVVTDVRAAPLMMGVVH